MLIVRTGSEILYEITLLDAVYMYEPADRLLLVYT